MSLRDPPDLFTPYDEAGQPGVPIAGYANTFRRNPSRPPFPRPYGRTAMTGPLDLSAKLRPGDDNLAVLAPGRMAMGQLVHISGRVLDEDGRGVPGAIVELWQANAAGRYYNPLDTRDVPLDPNFIGNGRTRTDADGRYAFVTIKPGAYPVPDSGRWWRPPHVHVSILGPSCLSRLVTQMYFPGEPLNAHDRLLHSLPDPAARRRLIATAIPPAKVEGEWLAFRFDVVLRGRHATPPAP
jgi:protocatechuate 3,4-dioxygenase beta subunit